MKKLVMVFGMCALIFGVTSCQTKMNCGPKNGCCAGHDCSMNDCCAECGPCSMDQ